MILQETVTSFSDSFFMEDMIAIFIPLYIIIFIVVILSRLISITVKNGFFDTDVTSDSPESDSPSETISSDDDSMGDYPTINSPNKLIFTCESCGNFHTPLYNVGDVNDETVHVKHLCGCCYREYYNTLQIIGKMVLGE